LGKANVVSVRSSVPSNTLKAKLNAPLFGDVSTAVDAVLFVLVLMLELLLAVFEPGVISALAEELLANMVLVLFVVFAVAAGVGEGAAAAAPAGFYCV
jgi:hypothetical protein